MSSSILEGSIEISESDGSELDYEVLSVPSQVEINTVSYTGKSDLSSTSAFPVHHFYIRCKEFADGLRLPLEANPRRPTDSPQVQEMQKTLGNEPENFVKKNNGMTILCKNLERGPNTVQIVFEEGEGICNGGHTYFAIQDYAHEIQSNAVVHIESIEIPGSLQGDARKKELANISRARNNNNKLERRSEADFNELFEPYKDWMIDPKLVEWREGDTSSYYDAIKAEQFIRLLQVMDPETYYHPRYCEACETHKSAATRVGGIFRKWMGKAEEARASGGTYPFEHLLPMINDILWLRDMISDSLANDDDLVDDSGNKSTKLRALSVWKNWIESGERNLRMPNISNDTGFNLPKPFEVMVLGLFRTDIALLPNKKGEPTLVGWYHDPETLWDQSKAGLIRRFNDYFKEADKDPNQFKRRVAPFEQNVYVLGTGQTPPDPQILYQNVDGSQFKRPEGNDATHWLDESSNELISLKEKSADQGASMYVKTNGW